MRLIIFIAFRQLCDRKLLNGIATGGVMLGVVVLLGIKGIMHGFQYKFYDSILRISPHVTLLEKERHAPPPLLATPERGFVVTHVVHQNPSERQLRIKRPREISAALAQMQGVTAVSISLVGSAVLSFGAVEYPVEIRGIDPPKQTRVTPIADYLVRGSYPALSQNPAAILLGSGVSSRLGATVNDQVVCATPRGDRLSLKVVGIFDASVPSVDNARVYVTLGTAQSLLGRPNAVGRVEARIADVAQAEVVARRAERIFGYHAESWQEANANFLGIFQMQNTITNFIVAAVLAVGGFGILAVQIMIVLQKTRDIAILRSVGFNRRDILSIFLLQGATVALIGSAVGCLVGHYLLVLLSHLKTHQEGLVKSEYFLIHDEPQVYVQAVIFAFALGLVASVVPALRGSRIEPVDVLRGQVA